MKRVCALENETISTDMARQICADLQGDRVEMLSFRNCVFTDKDYKKIAKAVGTCTSLTLRHLGLNVKVVCDSFRGQVLAQAILRNASLVGLHLHGSKLSDADFETLYPPLKSHPRLLTLDLSDCNLGDKAVDLICNLIKESKDSQGLHNLVLSHNPRISTEGWTKLGMALASGSGLRCLELDYNKIDDSVACCLATALPGAACLEMIDMGYTTITDKTGQVLLHLIKSYNMKLKSINLEGTRVLEETKEDINALLSKTHTNHKNDPNSDDACSLAMSEPPLDEHIDNGIINEDHENRRGSLDANEIPVVEISSVSKQGEAEKNPQLEEILMKEGTKSMSDINGNGTNLNAAGFEIKKAFSLTDLTDKAADFVNGTDGQESEMKDYEEYEAYIPERESMKHRSSVTTLVENIERIEDLEHDDFLSGSASIYSVKGLEETDDTFKSGNPSPLFYTRPMSAPMSHNDTMNVSSGVLNAKSTIASGTEPVDLASLIRQRKEREELITVVRTESISEEIHVQDIN